MVAGLAAVPFLLHRLGQERLGLLTLVWVVVGYFSFLDMGLGRAVTIAVAPHRAQGNAGRDQEREILGAASALLGGVAVVVAVLLAGACLAWGLPTHLSSPELMHEAVLATLVMLAGVPLLPLTSILRGYLEGIGAFRPLNLVRTPTGIMILVGPCLTAFWSPSLVWACLAILLARAAGFAGLLVLVARETSLSIGALARVLMTGAHAAWLRRLLSFGGWITVSNIVGPVVVYLDRFVIGAVMTGAAVAAYSVPFDVVCRLPLVVAALCSVLLPELARFSARITQESQRAAHRMVWKSTGASAVVVAVLAGITAALAPWLLTIWLGGDFARQSSTLTRILLLAFSINALAQIPFTALQASGNARAVALLHLAELLPYIALLSWAVGAFGLVGAAWAWTVRGLADYLALGWIWHRASVKNEELVE
jgi:O-antigen/teichoic acid export membrane protein